MGKKDQRWMVDGNTAIDWEPEETHDVSAGKQDSYLELTWRGKLLCMVLGLFELLLISLVFRIQLPLAPVVVTCFLWFLLAMVTGGLLMGAEEIREWIAGRGTMSK